MKKITNPIKEFIKNLDNMTIAKKTSLLFLNMVVGMLFIGSFAHMSLNRIKGDFDILYNKRMVPVIKLEKIKDIYTINILDTLRDIESGLISKKDGEGVIKLAQELIRRDWSEYKSSLSIKDESDWMLSLATTLGLIKKTERVVDNNTLEEDMRRSIEEKIIKIDEILLKIFNLFKRNKTDEAYEILQKDLYPSINSINIQLTQLTSLNLEAASSGRRRTEAVYESTFEWIVIATIGTMLVAAFLSIVILRNIRSLHTRLAEMVDKKTKELQRLNKELEQRVKFEVEKNRQKDEIMFRQSRLAAMGEMVGNIAHQWRQPLNAIVLIIQSFQMKKMVGKLDDKFIDTQVEEGIKLANSMSKTIDDFRNFFKPNRVEERFSVKKSVEEAIDLVLYYYKKHNIEINLICKSDFLTIGYPNEFSQVLMNLFSNAKDALLNLKDSEKKLIEVVIEVEKSEKSGFVKVIDNGGGVKEGVLDRMFEPYFTTKHQSSGTGIGLFMSKEIIEKQMNGSIWAQNISYRFQKSNKLYSKCACLIIELKIEED